jgi:glycosyltransferase involved in cell wall biosynthesis
MSLRILFAFHVPADPAAAVYASITRRASYLRSLGHSVEVVTPLQFGYRTLVRFQPLLFPLSIAARCRRTRYDLVVFHSYAGWAFHALRRVTDPQRAARTVTAFHGLEPLYYRALEEELERAGQRLTVRFRLLHSTVLPPLMRMSARRSTAVLCLNAEERAFLTGHGWGDPSRVFVFGNGVEKEFFTVRRHTGRGSRLLFLGQWLVAKGTRHLVRAFSELAMARPDVSLVCAGTGAPESVVLADFPETVRSRVAVRPRLDRPGVLAQFAEADAFLFPTLYEGFGSVLLEAMARGVPIVTTRTGAAQDFLDDGVNALLVPFADAGALAEAAGRLLDDPALRQRLTDNARSAAAGHEWSMVTQRYADLLLRIAGERPSTASAADRERHDAVAG